MSAEAVDVERVVLDSIDAHRMHRERCRCGWIPAPDRRVSPERHAIGALVAALLPLFAEVRAEGVEQGRGEVREQVTRLMLSRHDTQELSVRLPVGALRDALAPSGGTGGSDD